MVFQVGLSSWTFELDFRVGLSSWIFVLDFRVGFSSWTFEFEFVYNELDRNNGTRKYSQFGTREYSRVNVLNSIYTENNVGDSSYIVKYTAMNCWIISLTTICLVATVVGLPVPTCNTFLTRITLFGFRLYFPLQQPLS